MKKSFIILVTNSGTESIEEDHLSQISSSVEAIGGIENIDENSICESDDTEDDNIGPYLRYQYEIPNDSDNDEEQFFAIFTVFEEFIELSIYENNVEWLAYRERRDKELIETYNS